METDGFEGRETNDADKVLVGRDNAMCNIDEIVREGREKLSLNTNSAKQ